MPELSRGWCTGTTWFVQLNRSLNSLFVACPFQACSFANGPSEERSNGTELSGWNA